MPKLLRAVVVAGIVFRALLLIGSFGTNDMEAWLTFGGAVHRLPLCEVYDHVSGMFGQFNHPPLMAELVGAIFAVAEHLHVPFYVAFKLLPFAADVATTWLLFRLWQTRPGARGWLAAALYAWNLDAILVAAVHGNSDCIGAAACVAALYFVECRGAWLAGGLALGAAVNVKLIPLLLVPAFLAVCPSWRALARFVAGGALGIVPFLFPLAQCRATFAERVLRYTPHVDRWGVPYLLSEIVPRPVALAWFVAHGKPLLLIALALVIALGRFARRLPLHELCALSFALFLLLTPGFGVQYTVYVAPLILATSLWAGAVYGLAAGIFLASLYLHFVRWRPLPSLIHMWGRMPDPAPRLGFVVWLLLAGFVVWRLARRPAPRPL